MLKQSLELVRIQLLQAQDLGHFQVQMKSSWLISVVQNRRRDEVHALHIAHLAILVYYRYQQAP